MSSEAFYKLILKLSTESCVPPGGRSDEGPEVRSVTSALELAK